MGCFNLSGFYSHAPIQEGDRVGAILCIVEPGKDGCPIGSTGFGYHPVMAPVYGQYNDYGGIENIDESYTTKLFKDVVGIDFIEFVDLNHRNTETTLSDEDNGNRCDDIPGYQKYLRKIIPVLEKFESGTDVVDISDEMKLEIERGDKMVNDWKTRREMKSCVHIIYEHEDVLKCLEELGKTYCKYMESEVQDVIKKIEYPSVIDKYTPEELANLPEEERKQFETLLDGIKEMKIDSFKYTIDTWISLGDCNASEFDNALYFKDDAFKVITNENIFSAIKEIYSIAHALDSCGGYFCASKYDSQDSCIKDKHKVNGVISKILEEKLEVEKAYEEDEEN